MNLDNNVPNQSNTVQNSQLNSKNVSNVEVQSNNILGNTQNQLPLKVGSPASLKSSVINFLIQRKIFLIIFSLIILFTFGYLLVGAINKNNFSQEGNKNNPELTIVSENDSSTLKSDETTSLSKFLSDTGEELEISPTLVISASPSPTVLPVQNKIITKIPTKTPMPSATPTPSLDLHIEWIAFPRPAGAGQGCGAAVDLNHPVFCEVASSSQSLVSYFMEVRNNGDIDANNITVSLTLDGVTTDHKINLIKSKDKNTITLPLTGNVGIHQGKVVLNPNKNPQETKYDNNEKSFTLEIKPDSIAPTATLDVVNKSATRKCFSPFVMDNVNTEYELNLQLQINSGSWKTIPSRLDPGSELRYEECIDGSSGQEFVGKLKVTDRRGNVSEASANMIF